MRDTQEWRDSARKRSEALLRFSASSNKRHHARETIFLLDQLEATEALLKAALAETIAVQEECEEARIDAGYESMGYDN